MLDKVIRGHAQFQMGNRADERDFLKRLASEGQSPDALYVGCSDSRVVPEVLTSSSPGDLFVVRNIANLVPTFENADASVGAALEYAVRHLGVGHVIVCGHTGCGGVRAVIDDDPHVRELPSLYEWLAGVRPAVARARAALGEVSGEALWRRAVEENVLDQLTHLATYPPIAAALDEGVLHLHGWVYDLYTLDLLVHDPETDRFLPASRVMTE